MKHMKIKSANRGGGAGLDNTARLLRRYLWYYDLLARNQRGMTREELMEAWEQSSLNEDKVPLTERTFYQHRRAVEQLFDVDIICDRGGENRYRIEPQQLNDQSQMRRWVLENFTINMLLNDYEDIRDRILFENVPTTHSPYLLQLLEAMRENREVRLKYYSFAHERETEVILYPYAIRLFRQRWYLIAKETAETTTPPKPTRPFYDEEGIDFSSGIKVFSLDRIKELELLEETFELPHELDIKDLYKDCYGIIIGDEEWEYIQLKATKKQANFIRSLPLHHSQREEEYDDEHMLFTFRLRPTYDLFQTFLALGDAVEILSPKWVREEMAKRVERMYQMYRR